MGRSGKIPCVRFQSVKLKFWVLLLQRLRRGKKGREGERMAPRPENTGQGAWGEGFGRKKKAQNLRGKFTLQKMEPGGGLVGGPEGGGVGW